MKVAPVSIRPNNLINRKFRNLRKARNTYIGLAGANFAFAVSDAIAHKGFMTVLMGAGTLMSLKAVETTINNMLELKPQYKQIKDRAKNIDKIRTLNKNA